MVALARVYDAIQKSSQEVRYLYVKRFRGIIHGTEGYNGPAEQALEELESEVRRLEKCRYEGGKWENWARGVLQAAGQEPASPDEYGNWTNKEMKSRISMLSIVASIMPKHNKGWADAMEALGKVRDDEEGDDET